VETEVPDAQRQGVLIAWADAIFNGLSSNLLQFSPYPFVIEGATGQAVRVFPALHSRQDGDAPRGLLGWNVETGEPRSYRELKQRFIADGKSFPLNYAARVVSKNQKAN
jgi:hypothetical protein